MKNLTLHKGKAMACLIMLCLFVAQSCKKEIRPSVESQGKESQFIKEELIEHWLKQNPLSQVLAPDWTKARQALYQGKRIVRVPILNVDNLNYATAVSANNPGYYTQHPPELFFIQNTDGQMAGYLLNFIPKDAKHNFGENGIWTGDLVEWNIKGDTLHVMEIAANKIIKDKLIVPASTIKTNSLSAVLKQNKLAVAANNGNGGFWSFLGRVLGAIGNFLGLPTRDTIIDGLRIDWGQISTNIMSWFDGAESYDGGGGGGGGGYLSAGGPIYVSYLGTGVSSGGANTDISSMVYTQYNVYKSGGPYNPPVLPNEDGIYIMEYLTLSESAQYYIMSDHAIPLTKMLRDYLNVKGWTSENLAFASWAVEYRNEDPSIPLADFAREFINGDSGLDVSDLGTDGSGQDMNYSIYYDDSDGSFKPISKYDPDYNNVINNGTTSLSTNFAPCTTEALRQMGRDKGWDVGVSRLEFNRRVGQAFQEATFKLYKEKLIPLQRSRVTYQPQDNISSWRARIASNSGKVIPDWTYDVNFMGVSQSLSQHWFYDAKAVTGMLYLSSSKWQIGGYLDVLSKKKVQGAPPPALVFVTPVNTIISPSIIASAIAKGVQVRQSFVIIINNQLYLLQSIELTPANDRFNNIPTNMLKILAGPVDLVYPTNPNNGPDFEEVQ